MFAVFADVGRPLPWHLFTPPTGLLVDVLHLASDVLIATAYLAISATLTAFVYRARQALPFHWMFLAFGAFILGCGGTHFMHVALRLGWGDWWTAASIQAVTTVASLGVAVALPPLVPKALELIELARRSEEHRVALAHQATHDVLTGLPNRALFLDRLGHALARASRTGQTCAVLFLDLDGFKDINDTLGHAAGDRVLVATAERLQACVRTGDTLARLGGDEFVILLEEVLDYGLASLVAERLGEALSRPFLVVQREVAVTASVGIALSASPDDRPEDLLRCADVAMYRAKGSGKGNIAHFYQGPLVATPNTEAIARLTAG